MVYDIVIIGAGPTGSLAGIELAGLKALILERKSRIGYPKQCAEAISESVLLELGIELDKRWVNKRFTRADIYSPSGKKIGFDIGKRAKLVLERKRFDKYLADLAAADSDLLLGCDVDEITECQDHVAVKYKKNGRKFEVRSRLAIIATGADSRLARNAGLIDEDSQQDIMRCFQYEMEGLNCPDSLSLVFGSVAPGGYAWIFPKSHTRANVGIGVSRGNPKIYLDRFIKGMGGRIIEKNAGLVPLTPGQMLNRGRLFMIGDAARAVNPIHGGGLNSGLHSASIVAKAILESYDGKKFNARILRRCNSVWQKRFGKRHRLNHKVKEFIFKLPDEDFNRLFDIIDEKNVYALYEAGSWFRLTWMLLTRPKLYPILLRLFS